MGRKARPTFMGYDAEKVAVMLICIVIFCILYLWWAIDITLHGVYCKWLIP